MPRKKVTRLRKMCNLLAGHSWRQAERVAEAATESVRKLLPEGQEVVDLLHFQLCLGELSEEKSRRLTAIDDAHQRELQEDSNLREERNAAAADLRERSLQLRDSLDGLFGPGGSKKIFLEVPIIPADATALHQLMGRVRDNLVDEGFPLPRPLQAGFVLDRAAAVADLEEPFQRLGAALKALASAESESKRSQSVKDQEVADVELFTGRLVRFYEALYDLVGFHRLSDRLRRSSHAAANDEPESDAPAAGSNATQPAAGDPPAGDPPALPEAA